MIPYFQDTCRAKFTLLERNYSLTNEQNFFEDDLHALCIFKKVSFPGVKFCSPISQGKPTCHGEMLLMEKEIAACLIITATFSLLFICLLLMNTSISVFCFVKTLNFIPLVAAAKCDGRQRRETRGCQRTTKYPVSSNKKGGKL